MKYKRLTEEEVHALKLSIRKRDKNRCVLCGKLTSTVHEIVPKSHGGKRSEKIFREDNMACLCVHHHMELHFSTESGLRKRMTLQILTKLSQRYNYKYERIEK